MVVVILFIYMKYFPVHSRRTRRWVWFLSFFFFFFKSPFACSAGIFGLMVIISVKLRCSRAIAKNCYTTKTDIFTFVAVEILEITRKESLKELYLCNDIIIIRGLCHSDIWPRNIIVVTPYESSQNK